MVSVDRLKPAFSDCPILVVPLPAWRHPALPALVPALFPQMQLAPPSAAVPAMAGLRKSVHFQLPPSSPVGGTHYQAVHDRRLGSAIASSCLLGGVLWRIDDNSSVPAPAPTLLDS